jgi:hypothetical protein
MASNQQLLANFGLTGNSSSVDAFAPSFQAKTEPEGYSGTPYATLEES